MQLPATFDPHSKALMERVCYDAWWELRCSQIFPSLAAENELRGLMALRVMEAVGQGQRDPAKLRIIALACGAERLGSVYSQQESVARGEAERPWARSGRHAGQGQRVASSAVSRS